MEQVAEFHVLLLKYIHATHVQRPEILEEMRVRIQAGVNVGYVPEYSLHYIPLWVALECRCDVKLIQLLYEACPAAKQIQMYVQCYSNEETRTIYNQLINIKYKIVHRYGHFFRSMRTNDIDTVQYVLDCLKIMDICESDINWDWTLQNGIED
jgi:hypothetical protein